MAAVDTKTKTNTVPEAAMCWANNTLLWHMSKMTPKPSCWQTDKKFVFYKDFGFVGNPKQSGLETPPK